MKKYLAALIGTGFDIRFGVVFGSFARNEAHEDSDIDLIVVSSRFDPPMT